MQPLGNFEACSLQILKNMGGQILGYNTLHVSIECRGTTMAHLLVDTVSSLNVLPKKALDRLDYEGLTLKPSNIVVRAFDGSKRMVHREVDIPVKVGSQTF